MRFLSLLGIMLLMTSLQIVGQAISAPRRDEKGKSEPPGAVVEARLTAKQNTYTLDLNGKTAEEYQKQLKDATGNYPPPPKIDVVLELTNTSDKEVKLQFGGTRNVLTLDLQGPGAETVMFKGRATPRFLLAPKTITLAPGKSQSIPVTSLGFGMRNLTHAAYWTAPGNYTLKASYQAALSPAPAEAKDAGNGLGAVTLISAPLQLKVEAAK